MNLVVRQFGLVDYTRMLERMRGFVDARSENSADEIWCLEHPPVFTQGQGGRAVHVHDAGDIPLVQSDRGGQVTYHGPGQLVVYILMDLRRQGLGPRELVRRIEQGVIGLLETLGISASRSPGAPGVYVCDAKIAALGLRIRRGMSYHGLSLNVNLDLGSRPIYPHRPLRISGTRSHPAKRFRDRHRLPNGGGAAAAQAHRVVVWARRSGGCALPVRGRLCPGGGR